MSYMEYGIDLGTTNSCIARFEGDSLHVYQNNDLMNVTPSVVRVLRNGRIIVGKRAYNAVVDDPANVASEFKRWMGNKDRKAFPASGREMSPEELSAEVLKSLRDDVQRATGTSPTAAVITIPAAFGSLQCEATSRAAVMAGIEESFLLQEPIAAAIAYGASAEARDQRWLVYDLGGGTFDVAVISTIDGRLDSLSHAGNNLLGGKDIDRAIVETCIWPRLHAAFSLPDAQANPDEYALLFRRLAIKAEEAKIELSSSAQTTLSLFEIGQDLQGNEIELELTLARAELETIYQPFIDKTLELVDEALKEARITGADLNRILLVGGPTQFPYLRQVLGDHVGAPVDHSLDPMTVVARGAALYAQSVERTATAVVPVEAGVLSLILVHPTVSSETETVVGGRVENPPSGVALEVRINSRLGHWDSGWLPVVDGTFEMEVKLLAGKICPFDIFLRDGQGHTLATNVSDFTIRHGLELSSPPLPHTISVEVVRPNGRTELEPVFPRNTPLPAEKRLPLRANHTLRPGDESAGAITVKLWEGEELAEPEANTWVGNAQIAPSMIRRPIPEDSEIDLFFRIDASRLISIEMFVPHLNQHFSEGVYLAQREQQDESNAAANLTRDIEGFTARVEALAAYVNNNPELEAALKRVRRQMEDLDIEVTTAVQQQGLSDPERARRLVASGRDLRTQISALEKRVGLDRRKENQTVQTRVSLDAAREIVEEYGDTNDRFEFEMLRKDFEVAAARLDERGVRRVIEAIDTLKFRILFRQPWFWRTVFEQMDKSDTAFTNPRAAQEWLEIGERAIREGNTAALQDAVRKLWALQSTSVVEEGMGRAAGSGVKS